VTHRVPPLITGIDGDAVPTDPPHGGIDGDTVPANPPHGGIDGDAVGAGFIPALTPQDISKICGRGERITVKGVRAGMNPAPTLSLQCEYFKGLCL